MMAVDRAAGAAGLTDTKEALDPTEYPIARAVTRNTTPKTTRYIQRLWEMQQKLEGVKASLRRFEDDDSDASWVKYDQTEQRNEALLDNEDDINYAVEIQRQARKEITEIRRDNSYTPKEKRAEIDFVRKDAQEAAREVIQEIMRQ